MKSFRNYNASSLQDAAQRAQRARAGGELIAFSGGGTDLLQQMKEGTVNADLLINLRQVSGADQIISSADGLHIGALTHLSSIAAEPLLGNGYRVLAEAAAQVGSPQIRNVGTLGGNISQRPWCWYYRNGFPCFKAGGQQCFSVTGENQLHAIFGGGPSYIVHPSDLAPALLALDAEVEIAGPQGNRRLAIAEFFSLPTVNPARENVMQDDELVAAVHIPAAAQTSRSRYHKIMDRATWTHAVVSAAVALQMDAGRCTSARIVLGGVAPVPWRVPQAEALLIGQELTPELARQTGEKAVDGAQPLARNAYKVPLAAAVVERTLMELMS